MRSLEEICKMNSLPKTICDECKRKNPTDTHCVHIMNKEIAREHFPSLEEPNQAALFVTMFELYASRVHRIAKEKGWWDNERNSGELIALVHSELSECLEALRHGNPPDDKIPDFTGAEAELADAIIRIMDLAAAKGWCVGEAIVAKMRYNERREYKHGKQF